MAEVIMGTVRSRTRITREGEFEEYYEVEFFVDDARHTLVMLPRDYTAEKAEAAVKKMATQLATVKGKKVVI